MAESAEQRWLLVMDDIGDAPARPGRPALSQPATP